MLKQRFVIFLDRKKYNCEYISKKMKDKIFNLIRSEKKMMRVKL